MNDLAQRFRILDGFWIHPDMIATEDAYGVTLRDGLRFNK